MTEWGTDALADPRAELARLARALRLIAISEREGGLATLTGEALPDAPTAERAAPAASGREAAAAAAGAGAAAERRAASDRTATEPPRALPPRAAPQSTGRATTAAPRPAEARTPAAARRPATSRAPLVAPLDLPADALAPFGDLPARVEACRLCALGTSRTCAVFGEGSPTADLVFCGEAPGLDEDRSGRPFVGKAGELLTAMIVRGMQLRREDVYVLNTLKCRPPRNRSPLPAEIAACRPHLEEQLAIVRPRVIVAMGNHAVRALLGEQPGITRIRGQVFQAFGAQVVPTFHPSYLLRNQAAKREAWEDLQVVMRLLGSTGE